MEAGTGVTQLPLEAGSGSFILVPSPNLPLPLFKSERVVGVIFSHNVVLTPVFSIHWEAGQKGLFAFYVLDFLFYNAFRYGGWSITP